MGKGGRRALLVEFHLIEDRMYSPRKSLVALVALVALVHAAGCESSTEAESMSPARDDRSAALVGQVDPGVVFISPAAPGAAAHGDLVVTAEPMVRVDLVDAPEGTPPLAEFTRHGSVFAVPAAPEDEAARIRAVLQDAPGDPQDLDADFNPVGYFQIRWKTSIAEPGRTYRLSVVVPDGRVVGVTDGFVAANRDQLRKVDRSKATGVLAGTLVNIRFRVDAAAVDADGDGVLDWGDNCPQDANATQEDLDQNGLGDACDACPPTQCLPGRWVDPATCACACAPCPAGFVADPATCACLCDAPAGDPCPGDFALDPRTCRCACPPTLCPPGSVLDPATCGCVCDRDACSGVHVQDPNTCGCACPQAVRGDPSPCPGPGEVLDPSTCACVCPDVLCPAGHRMDPTSCGCVCQSACGPGQVQDPVDCTCACEVPSGCEGGQVLDPVACDCRCPDLLLPPCAQGQNPQPPGSLCPVCFQDPAPTREVVVSRAIAAFDAPDAACSGLATDTLADVLSLDGAIALPLDFGPVHGCALGTCNRTAAFRLPIAPLGASGLSFDADALLDALPQLADVRCWLAYREGEGLNGEIRYLSTQDPSQRNGGGIYGAPPPEVSEVFLVCDGQGEAALQLCPQVSRVLHLSLL